MDVESMSKKPKVWWVILFEEKYVFFNKIKRTTPSET